MLSKLQNVTMTYSQIFLNREIQQHYEKFYDEIYFIRISFVSLKNYKKIHTTLKHVKLSCKFSE